MALLRDNVFPYEARAVSLSTNTPWYETRHGVKWTFHNRGEYLLVYAAGDSSRVLIREFKKVAVVYVYDNKLATTGEIECATLDEAMATYIALVRMEGKKL